MSFISNLSRRKIIFWVVVVALAILGFFIVWLTQESPTIFQKKIATNIAWEELLKHYPDGKSFDITYEIVDVRPRPDKGPNIWEVTYDLPNGPTDQMIWITVDVEKGEVLLFDQAAS